jgi:hypothetical protein
VYPTASPSEYAAPPGSGFDLSYPQTPGAPPSRWRSGAAWLAVSAGVILGFGAGYAVADSRHRNDANRQESRPSASASASPAPTTPAPTPKPPFVESDEPSAPEPSPSQSPTEPLDPNASLLDRVGLRPTDVDPSATVALIPGGDRVAGQTTLDLCDGAYPSESNRRARRQVVAVSQAGGWILSTEAVLYDSPASLDAAFKELAAASGKCAQTGIDKAWPQVAGVVRQAYDTPVDTQTGPQGRGAVVYLRHDRALLALYFHTTGALPSPVAGQKTVEEAVAVFAKRLAALPPTVGVT